MPVNRQTANNQEMEILIDFFFKPEEAQSLRNSQPGRQSSFLVLTQWRLKTVAAKSLPRLGARPHSVAVLPTASPRRSLAPVLSVFPQLWCKRGFCK